MNEQAAPRKRRWLKRLGLSAGLSVIFLGCLGLYAYSRWNSKPEMWSQERERIARMGSDQKEAMAESLRNRLLTEWAYTEHSEEIFNGKTDSLLGQRRTFAIPYDQLNVWLDVEGRSLLEGVGIGLPERVRHVLIRGTDDGLLVLSFEDRPDGNGRVYSFTFNISIAGDGMVTSELVEAKAGRLSIPTDAAAGLISSTSTTGRGGPNLLDALLTGKPVRLQDIPIDPGEDGMRDGRIVGLEITPEAILVTRETVARPQR